MGSCVALFQLYVEKRASGGKLRRRQRHTALAFTFKSQFPLTAIGLLNPNCLFNQSEVERLRIALDDATQRQVQRTPRVVLFACGCDPNFSLALRLWGKGEGWHMQGRD